MDEPTSEDVTDLDEARRIIAELRHEIRRLEELVPLDNEIWIETSEEDLERLQKLYDDGKLTYEQGEDPGMEVDEALMYFFSGAIDVAWDMAYHVPFHNVTPSA